MRYDPFNSGKTRGWRPTASNAGTAADVDIVCIDDEIVGAIHK